MFKKPETFEEYEVRYKKWTDIRVKALIGLIGLAAGVALGIGATLFLQTYQAPDATPIEVALFERITRLNELATASQRYTVAQDVENAGALGLPITSNRLIVVFEGELKAGVNLDDAVITADENAKRVEIYLPSAQILSNSYIEGSMETLYEQDGAFNKVTSDDTAGLLDQGLMDAEAKAIEGDLLTEAQQNAQMSVQAVVEASVGDEYEIVFVDEPPAGAQTIGDAIEDADDDSAADDATVESSSDDEMTDEADAS